MGAAASVKVLVPYWQHYHVVSVVDYGAGNLRNSRYLKNLGFKVIAVETPHHLKKIDSILVSYQIAALNPLQISNCRLESDLVLLNFVLNTIGVKERREEIIRNAYLNLKPGGFFLVEVKERNEDSLAKGMSESELDNEIMHFGFEKELLLRRRGLLAVLYRKFMDKSPENLFSSLRVKRLC
ncbi:MAG: class I SAM-dependent methyltransferase [Bacillota bacterium]|nr:hypothetical protein [Clostridia bacterium]